MANDKQRIPDSEDYSEERQELAEAVAVFTIGSSLISDAIKKWIHNSTSLKILIAGKTGTGKSTIINALLGKNLAKEGHNLTSETHRVKQLKQKIGDVDVSVFDTPGICDHTTAAGSEENVVSEIQANCSSVDLFLYCITMSETRLPNGCDDFIALKTIHKALGNQLWTKGLIVLTFANDMVEMAKAKKAADVRKFFKESYDKICGKIRTFLRNEVKIDSENIAIVCAGHSTDPILPNVLNEPTIEVHWLSNLWLKAVHKTQLCAKPAMVKLNLGRLKNKDNFFLEEKMQAVSELAELQPIMLSHVGARIGQRVLQEAGGSGAIGSLVGETAGQQLASNIKRQFGMSEDEESEVPWLLIEIALSEDGVALRISNS